MEYHEYTESPPPPAHQLNTTHQAKLKAQGNLATLKIIIKKLRIITQYNIYISLDIVDIYIYIYITLTLLI